MANWTRAFTLRARAKLNLRLDIGGVKPSGLHALRSLAACLTLADELRFSAADGGFSVSCTGAEIPETDNLVWRAGVETGLDLGGVHVEVVKRIPIAAGLGGGSADAAAALLGFARVAAERGRGFADELVLRAAQALGSDVPACLFGGLKIMEGSGDIVRPIALRAPAWGVLLAKPDAGMSTHDAYRLLDSERAGRGRSKVDVANDAVERLATAVSAGDFGDFSALVHNDFDDIVDRALPAVADLRQRLVSAGAGLVVLCGSGSCLAALFETRSAAADCAARLERRADEWISLEGFADGA